MGALIETWRGANAVARWFLGAPVMAYRMAYRSADKYEAHGYMAQSFIPLLKKCRITIETSGTPPARGAGCVVSHNESSFVDVVAFCTDVLPHIDRFGAAELYGRIPLAGRAFQKAAGHLVPRGNREGTDCLMAEIVPYLQAGDRVGWGGEGRLSGKDEVTRFKVGASLLAIRAEVPIYPVAFYGGHHIMPLGSYRARPGTAYVRFGDPIPTDGFTEDRARDLADYVQSVVTGMYADLKREAGR